MRLPTKAGSARSLLASSDFPRRRPESMTLNRLALVRMLLCASCGAGNDSGSAELLVSACLLFPACIPK